MDITKLPLAQLGVAGVLAIVMMLAMMIMWAVTSQILIPLFITRFLPSRAAVATPAAAITQAGHDISAKLDTIVVQLKGIEVETRKNDREILRLRPEVHKIPSLQTGILALHTDTNEIRGRVDRNSESIAELRGRLKAQGER